MTEFIFNPPIPKELTDFFRTLLSVSGVLFGIAFAAMLFVLQSGFSTFKFSRRMFLELYLHFGRQLLYSLAYLTAAPFFVLYYSHNSFAVTSLYVVYLVIFCKATLDYAKEEGNILTLFSSKVVPRKFGKVRSYFRYIRNRGFHRNIIHFVPIVLLYGYPFWVSYLSNGDFLLTEIGVFYSCLIPLLYSLFKITRFIPQFFHYTGMELKSSASKSNGDLTEEEKNQNIIEKQSLYEHLISHGISELDPLSAKSFLDGDLSVQFLKHQESGTAFFNVQVQIHNATPDVIRNSVIVYAHDLAKQLYSTKNAINSFVLSFHIRIASQSSRNMFFRFNRRELDDLFAPGRDSPEDMEGLKNVVFDELFRN